LAADGVAAVVVDCESGPVRLQLAGVIAADLDATLVRLEDLADSGLRGLVGQLRGDRRGVA
jgi:magnesium chelatase subunit D